LDAEKNKKLQQYATILTDQAKEAEQSGKSDEAIKHYLKLVDVLLVLASEAPDQGTWMQYIRQAEAYQTRIRSLVPKDQPTQDIVGRIPPPPAVEKSAVQTANIRRDLGSPGQSAASSPGLSQTTTKTGPISKIFKPFQSGRESPSDDPLNQFSGVKPASGPISPSTTVSQLQSLNSPQVQKPVVFPAEERSPVPHEVYERSLSENKVLHERLQSVIKETDDKVAFLESRNRELEERVAMMVSRTEYEQLRAELENMVPKHEYDRIKTELSNTVPITHYDQLLDRIANMVPRDIYMNSERRVLELEDTLRNSVPLAVIDDIANEVSYVSILAEVPPIVNDPSEKKKIEEEKDEGEDKIVELLREESSMKNRSTS
jgi:hypothetical protein